MTGVQTCALPISRINELEKKEAATAAALPLMFELNKVNAERYADNCCCKTEKSIMGP